MSDLIQVRRDIAANWTSNNPVLASGEWGLETDTGTVKIGDGSTHWNSLTGANIAGMTALLAAKAALASPTFTGDPKAPTQASSDNDTSLATTAFVHSLLGGTPPGVIDSAGAYANTGNPALVTPATALAGDMLVVFGGGNFDVSAVTGGNVTPEGWSRVAGGVGSNQNGSAWVATATATSAGSTINLNTSSNGGDGYVVVVRGWKCLAGLGGAQTGGSVTSFPAPLVNAAHSGVLVLGFATARVGGQAMTSNLPNLVLRRTSDSTLSSGVWSGSPSQMLSFIANVASATSVACVALAIA